MRTFFSPWRIAAAAVVLALPVAYAVVVAAQPDGYLIDPSSDPTIVPLPRRNASVADLIEYRWQVQLATRADGNALALLQADAIEQVYLEFSPRRMMFSGGGNEISAFYRIDGAHILATDANGRDRKERGFVSTATGGWSERPQATDQLLLEHLRPPFRHWLEGSDATQRLHLIGADGTHFILQTTDAAFGAKGEPVSLEVAAQERHCSAGCAPNLPPSFPPNCVSARKLRWVKYMPQPASDWFALPRHAFEGRRVEPGRHQVLSTRHYPSLSGRPCSAGIYVVDSTTRYEDIPKVEVQGDTVAAAAVDPR